MEARPSSASGGSYELYHEQRRSLGERISPNLGQAPGCPGSLPESAQKVEELSHQLYEARVREDKLRQQLNEAQVAPGIELRTNQQPVINTMSNHRQQQEFDMHSKQGQLQQTPVSFSSQGQQLPQDYECQENYTFNRPPEPHNKPQPTYVNINGVMSPPSSESVGENVKDGHIKHLQRQVTILQANLYKADEARHRASEMMKDRDQAIDQYRTVSHQLGQAAQENEGLRTEMGRLKDDYVHIQHRLRQTLQELEVERRHEHCQGQMAKLKEELNTKLSAAHGETDNLKSQLSSLAQENSRLKDQLNTPGNTSDHFGVSGNVACSSELEYLHTVVDTLKKTVIEQRDFLKGLKGSPSQTLLNGARGPGQAMTRSAHSAMDRSLQKLGPGRPVLVPHNMESSSALHAGQGDSHPMRGQGDSHPMRGQGDSHPVRQQAGASGDSRLRPAPAEMGTVNGGRISSPHRVLCTSSPSNTSSSVTSTLSASSFPTHPSVKKNVNRTSSEGGNFRNFSESEIITGRPASVEPHARSKSDIVTRQQSSGNGQSKPIPQWVFDSTAGYGIPASPADTAARTVVPSGIPNTPPTPRRRMAFEAAMLPLEPDQSAATPRQDGSPARPTVADVNQSAISRASASQQIFRPPVLYSDSSSIQVITTDLMGGSRVTTTGAGIDQRPPPQTVDSQVWREGAYGSSSHTQIMSPRPGFVAEAGDPVRNKPSDRVCPVCNRDYSDVTMEDFQTHVFECFDDENAPETMKPQESLDRTCPMCTKKYPSDMPQHEFEAHVHSHFGEESFEMLHRERE